MRKVLFYLVAFTVFISVYYSPLAHADNVENNQFILNKNISENIIKDLFEDGSFAQVVAEALKKDVTDSVTQKELEGIRTLIADHRGIESLKGIENLTSLTYLDASNNQITDINPLTHTSLEYLYLSGNSISDISPVKKLSLRFLFAPYQNIIVKKYWKNDLSLPNPIKNPEGSSLDLTISGQGIYKTTEDIFSWQNILNQKSLTISWAESRQNWLGYVSYSFYGTYTLEYDDNATVEVSYLDDSGSDLAPKEVISGKVGETYKTVGKEIDGWYNYATPDNEEGVFQEGTQKIIYKYKNTPILGGNIFIHYQDNGGKEIREDEILRGHIGEKYESEQLEISGYNFLKAEGNTSGAFSDFPQEITYIYEKNKLMDYSDSESGSASALRPTEIKRHGQTKDEQKRDQSPPFSSSQEKLPNSGEGKSFHFTLLGLGIIFVSFFGLKKTLTKNDN